MKEYRYELRYLSNGQLLEKCTRMFEGGTAYPDKLIHPMVEDFYGLLVPSNKENFMEHSIELESAFKSIVALCKKVLEHDSKNYLYNFYTSNEYAKEGEYHIPGNKKNSITIELVDSRYPVYADGKKTAATLSQSVYSKTFHSDHYIPINNYTPNFWMVFYDWDEKSFDNNKRVEGDNPGIISYLNEVMDCRRYTNKYSLPPQELLKLL